MEIIVETNRLYAQGNGGEKCQTPHVTEEEVKIAFITAFNRLIDGKGEIIANINLIKRRANGYGA